MQKVIIYPGRFQPMLKHHAEVFKKLQAQFPDADVYVGTSDKVDDEKSPFNFEEKQLIATAHGIPADRVLKASRPYHKDDYQKFDEDNTVIIFAVGEKDLDRFPFNNVDPATGLDMTVRGETRPKYYQSISTMKQGEFPMKDRGYITLAPTVMAGDDAASASAFRNEFKNSPNEESAKKLFVDQFGEYNDKVFNLIYNKIVRNKMTEEMSILKKLAGINEAPVDFNDYQTISPKDAKAAAARPAQAAASDPTAAKFLPPDPKMFHSTIAKSVANRINAEDPNDPEAKKEHFMMELLRAPATLLGEINARLANDDNGLAVSDRLSSIIEDLGEGGLRGLENDDRQFVIKLVANAIKNMDLVKDPKAGQDDDEEDELEDSVNFDDIRAEYGVEGIEEGDGTEGQCPECDGSGCDHCDDTGMDPEFGNDDDAPSQEEIDAHSKDDKFKEGFDPDEFDGEIDWEGVGDDGETSPCTVSYVAKVDEMGRPVVDPKSIRIRCKQDANSKLGFDPDFDLEMQDMDELLQACQEDADEMWDSRDNKYAHGESIEETADKAFEEALKQLRQMAGV